MNKKIGSTVFINGVYVNAYAATVGKKEHEGPLGNCFARWHGDELCGKESFEKAESSLQKEAVRAAMETGGFSDEQIDCIYGGDLLNQCTGSNYGMRDLGIPFSGVYGACSTMALAMINASFGISSGAYRHAAAVTSSHFCSAERQFRYPLEYGNQRTPTAQWTVTGAGCVILGDAPSEISVEAVTVGRITDFGVTDINNMGAAMAPAAADTIKRYFKDSGASPEDFDLILTGDLGFVGSELLCRLLRDDGISIGERHNDCGMMIYDRRGQDVHAGGSGCGCSASVLCAKILPELAEGVLHDILFCATGALMSTTTVFQGETIPAIAHLVRLKRR